MIGFWDVFWGGILPALVALLTLSIVWRYTHQATAAWLGGLCLGYLAGHWGLDIPGVGLSGAVWKSLNPREARDWLPLAVVAATAIELLPLIWPKVARWVWLLRGALCIWLPWRLLKGSVYLPDMKLDFGFETQSWNILEALSWLGSAGLLMGLIWLAARQLPEASVPRLRASLATLVALAGTATVAMSGSLTTGQLLGVLTATLVGCGIAASAWRLETGPEAAAGPLLTVFCGVLVVARFLLVPELGLVSTFLLLVAAYAVLGWMGPQRAFSTRGQAFLRTAVCLGAIAACVVPAARDFAASQAQESENPYQSFSP